MAMGRRKHVADNPISKNLDKLLGEANRKDNFDKIERELGIAHASVQNWINGKRRPLFDSLEKIATLFKIDVYSLLKEEPAYTPEQQEIIDMIPCIYDKDVLEALKMTAKLGIIKGKSKNNDAATNS